MLEDLQDGERAWIADVVENLADDDLKLVYADWLEDHEKPDASKFVRDFVAASRSMRIVDFPPPEGFSAEWLDLLGYSLLRRCAEAGLPDMKSRLLRWARPALRLTTRRGDPVIGTSKVGGLPDVPPGFSWPRGEECRAIYNDDTDGYLQPAGFLAQINLAHIAETQSAKVLPKSGLLSFFSFQDMENDRPDAIGAKVLYFPETDRLERMKPPAELTYGNELMSVSQIYFAEMLDFPEASDSPWSEELQPQPNDDEDAVFNHFRELNFNNFLGYGRATTGDDPTPSRESRHLIILTNSLGCRLHLQIHQNDLAAQDFDKVTLNWVDFD